MVGASGWPAFTRMKTNIPGSGRIFGPDLIRAFAISLVLFAHTLPGGTMFPALGAARYYLGVLGVESFFLLSGYLIGGILMEELFSGRLDSIGGTTSFWKRRWFRTLPNYYLFLILTLLMERAATGQFPQNGGRFFWFSQAFFWPDPDFFAGAWSLAIEEWFYLLFPLVLFAFARLLNKRLPALLLTIVLFLVVPALFRAFLPTAVNWDAGVRRITVPRLDAIGYGVVLAFAKNYYVSAWNFLTKLWPLGVIAVSGFFAQFCYHVVSHGYFTSDSIFYRGFYFCFLSLSLMLAFPKVAELTEPVGWWKVAVQKMSLWSYSIYLCHPIIIGLIDGALKHFGVSYIHAHLYRFIFAWLICVSLSGLIYRFYEKPFMNLREQPLKSIFRWPQWAAGAGEKT
jgi:peptidoglycan/LPS O-acetylase OafA/YrhL